MLQQALEQTRRENTLLRQKLDALARRFFGKKSEQLNAAQLELLLSGLAEGSVELTEEKEPPARPAPRRSRTHTRRIRTPDNLEVVREVIEPELVQAEPEQWKRIGQEVSRQLDYQPGKFFWQETVRPKYVRRDQRALPPVIAPAPERVAEHSLAAPGLLAQLLVSKYCDHLPFYRQEQIFWQRHGVFIARQQMVQWTAQSVRLLSGITDCLKQELQGQPLRAGGRDAGALSGSEPARAAAGKATCGRGWCPASAWSMNGTPAVRRAVWTRCWEKTLPASSSATATAPIRPLRKRRRRWTCLAAGRTRGAASLKPRNKRREWRAGS